MTELQKDNAKWSFASGWVAALESQMVASDFYDRLLQASQPSDILPGLGGSLLADIEINPGELKDSEAEIALFYRKLMGEIRDKSPFSDVADIILWRNDLRAFRNYLKRTLFELEVSEADTIYGEDFWASLWSETAPEAPDAFKYVAARTKDFYNSENSDVSVLDAAFDSAVLAALGNAAAGIKSPFISKYMRRYDIVKGVEFIWRAKILEMPENLRRILLSDRVIKDILIELDDTPINDWDEILDSHLDGFNFSELKGEGCSQIEYLRSFVNAADDWLMHLARDAKLVAFGPERIFGALLGLDVEAYNMRVAVVGRANGIAPDLLKQHLRTGYV